MNCLAYMFSLGGCYRDFIETFDLFLTPPHTRNKRCWKYSFILFLTLVNNSSARSRRYHNQPHAAFCLIRLLRSDKRMVFQSLLCTLKYWDIWGVMREICGQIFREVGIELVLVESITVLHFVSIFKIWKKQFNRIVKKNYN